ncbi:MAG: PspC domain-containing protein [Actinomycetota bacterium]
MSTSPQPRQTSPPLRRPIDDRAFAGVASGIGRRLDISPTLIRVGFVLLTLFGGVGLFLYVAGWLLIPEEGSDEPLLAQWVSGFDTTNTGMVVGVVLIGIAALMLFSSFHLFSGKFFFAAILLIAGVLLYRGDLDRPKGSEGPPPPPTPGMADEPPPEVEMDYEPSSVVADGGGGDTAPLEARTVAPSPPPPPRPRRPRSILGRLTVAATLMGVGGLALLDVAEILYPEPVHYMALTVALIGAGLLVGALFGRARWLIVVGLLLLPPMWLANVGPTWSINSEVGEHHYHIETLEELQGLASATGEGEGIEIAAGSLHIDLSDLVVPPDGAPNAIPITASVGAGELVITLPVYSSAVVEASVGIGSVEVFGDQSAGIGVSRSYDTGREPSFIIDVSAGVGSVVVND